MTIVGLNSPERWPAPYVVRCLDLPLWALSVNRLPSLGGEAPQLIFMGTNVSVSTQELEFWDACYKVSAGRRGHCTSSTVPRMRRADWARRRGEWGQGYALQSALGRCAGSSHVREAWQPSRFAAWEQARKANPETVWVLSVSLLYHKQMLTSPGSLSNNPTLAPACDGLGLKSFRAARLDKHSMLVTLLEVCTARVAFSSVCAAMLACMRARLARPSLPHSLPAIPGPCR